MSYTNRINWETLRSIDSATLTGTYAALGTPLVHPAYKLKLVNNSNVLVTISLNGTSDVDVAPANSFWLYDESIIGQNCEIPAIQSGTQIYVKGPTGTGLIYLVSQYIILG